MELFPVIHTNFWDAVIAVPAVLLITQLIKVFMHVQPKYVPAIALAIGLIISIFISHRHNLIAGIFMGFLWLRSYWKFRCIKTTINNYKSKKLKE